MGCISTLVGVLVVVVVAGCVALVYVVTDEVLTAVLVVDNCWSATMHDNIRIKCHSAIKICL